MARILLAGYFGCGNIGDDAILLGTVEGLRQSPHEFAALSGSPEETYRIHGINAYPRKDMKAVHKALSTRDALVFAGGSIFQDVTSLRSVYYYANLVKTAKGMGKKVIMVGQGVGPVNRFFGKRWTASAFSQADAIVVRDPASAALLSKLGVKKKVRLAADPAFLLPPVASADEGQGFALGNMKAVGLAPRPFGKKTPQVIELFGGLARLLFQANVMPYLIEMDRNADRALIDAIEKQQGGKIPDLRKIHSPIDMQKRLSRMDAVIAMRLHAGILASTVGVPPYMVSYDPKVAAFAKMLEFNAVSELDNTTPQRLFDGFMVFQKSRERNVALLQSKTEEFVKLATVNIDAILEAL